MLKNGSLCKNHSTGARERLCFLGRMKCNLRCRSRVICWFCVFSHIVRHKRRATPMFWNIAVQPDTFLHNPQQGRRKLPKARWASCNLGSKIFPSGCDRVNWSAKTWMGNCLLCPPISYVLAQDERVKCQPSRNGGKLSM